VHVSGDNSSSSAPAETVHAVTSAAKSEKAAYGRTEEKPVGSYAALTAVYGTSVVAFAAAVRLTGRKLPERLQFSDIALMGVATHKLARLVAKDKVTSFIRAPFTEFDEDSSSAEVMEQPRGRGPRQAVGELLACPFCLAQWVATGFTYGMVFAPRATRLATSMFTAIAASDFLQYAYAATQQKVEG